MPIAICATHNPVLVRRAAETDATLSRYWVGGRLVVETLLDVLRFFDRCDLSLARIGELTPRPRLDIHGHQ
ncbi:hypothetical protein ACIBJI_40530 [Nocardia sp. NPDC050408]|uniref:hypothetical protein n=1 Tax=unclassified Nocardia TaxID=2637762 RepID=UPI00342F943C